MGNDTTNHMLPNLKFNSLGVLAILTLAAAPTFAAPVFVSNYSFETLPVGGLPSPCGAGCSYSATAIPGWSISGANT